MQLSLSPQLQEIIKQQMELGYDNPEEVMREALLQLDAVNRKQLEQLRAAVAIGAEQAERRELGRRSLEELKSEARRRAKRQNEGRL